MSAYYNEFDPHAAAWLRELIKAGHIADGDVDERSIIEVTADDVKGYTQQHFFAGIGGWSLAARLAGWPDDKPLFTGSPPCQPFSTAGKQLGKEDARHLAPHWLELVRTVRPPFVAGEQVAAAVNKDHWLDDLLDALEAENYTTGAIVLPASFVGSPHIRQRIWFVGRLADPNPIRQQGQGEVGRSSNTAPLSDRQEHRAIHDGERSGMAHAEHDGCAANAFGSGNVQPVQSRRKERQDDTTKLAGNGAAEDDSMLPGCQRGCDKRDNEDGLRGERFCWSPYAPQTGWDNPDWLFCRDGKWRPVESGTFPLVNGLPRGVVYSGDPCDTGYANQTAEARVMRLKGYGNAIVPEVAAEVLKELLKCPTP